MTLTRLKLILLWIAPKSFISLLVGWAARLTGPKFLVQAAIRLWVRVFDVDLSDVIIPPEGFRSLNEFFARPLKEGARTIEGGDSDVACPVDGRLAAMGRINKGAMIQAKGLYYTLEALLADRDAAAAFDGGFFMTLYLSPRDYHHIHAPLSGTVSGYVHCPGTLFPVNDFGTNNIKGLLTRNERIVTSLETDWGRAAVVKVGAMCVGGVRLAYDDGGVRLRPRTARRFQYGLQPSLERGSKLGCFEMGSTVVLIFEPGRFEPAGDLEPGLKVRVGRILGKMT